MNEARKFLNTLFAGIDGYLELTYIDPRRHYGLSPAVRTDSYLIGSDRIDWEHVTAMNERGYGVYYGLTTKHNRPAAGKRATESSAQFATCLWSEVDLSAGGYTSLGDIKRALNNMPKPPTIQIASGGGIHALWKIAPVFVTKDNFEIIKRTLRGLGKAINGDLSVAELARVFRLPGTANTKPDRDGAMCRVSVDYGPYYALEDFAEYTVRPKRKAAPFPKRAPGDGMPSYLRWFLTTIHTDGTRNNVLNWTAHKMRGDGFSIGDAESLLLPHAMACGLNEHAAMATIRSPYKGNRS